MVDVTALAELRRRTAASHRAVERAVGLLAPDITLDAYADVLARFARVHAVLDAELVAHAPFDLPYTARLPLLAADLASLGRTVPPSTAPARPVPSPARVLGARYVMEGSRLGGAVIVRHLRRVVGAVETGSIPVRYLTVDGSDAAAAWAAFTARAESDLCRVDDVTAAADAAVDVFALVYRELLR